MYGVDIGAVREIIPVQKIVPVPRAPDFVEGVINLRGRVIPVLDLIKHFGFQRASDNGYRRIMLVDVDGESIGVAVDSVSSVLWISPSQIEPPAEVVVGPHIDYIQGIAKVDDGLIVLVDLSRIISDAEKKAIKNANLTQVPRLTGHDETV